MIRIACTNCKTVLSIDDAFAGGVCRCQQCGTIQTVPASAKGSGGSGEVSPPGTSMGGSKSLYQGEARVGERLGTGLDELAGVVVSSGLSSGRLTRTPAPGKSIKQLLPLLIAGGAVILLLLGVIIFLIVRQGSTPSGTTVNPTGGGPVVAVEPNFAGIKLTGNSVVYLLDSGTASQSFFGDLKEAALRSAESLGPDRKFAVVFWGDKRDNDYPPEATTYATHANIENGRGALGPVNAAGQTDVREGFKAALSLKPDVIVIVTCKAWDLSDNWDSDLMELRGGSPVKIDAVSCTNDSSVTSQVLKDLARKTGGAFKQLTGSDLKAVAEGK